MTEAERKRKGRPATGRRRRHEVHSYLDDKENEEAHLLADFRRVGVAELIRQLIREAARRERIGGGE